jgi:N-acyl-D-amino-acid deacylase
MSTLLRAMRWPLLTGQQEGLHREPNSLSSRRGERVRERGGFGPMRRCSTNLFKAFPSPRPSPHSFVMGRGSRGAHWLPVCFVVNPAVCSVILLLCFSAEAETWDVWIRHGTIIDGTGRKGFSGDVAIKDGHIARVGQVEGLAKREVDASGLVIAPGFIDVHTHAEGILNAPEAENFVRMGVTTVIVGNCGASVLSVGDFFRALAQTKVSINVATLIGHNVVREEVMGSSSLRPPNDEELTHMKLLVEQAMKDGAVGFSTGLIYSPGKYAKPEEIVELAKVAAAYHGIYASHIRNEQEGLIESLEEAFQVGRAAKVPVQISHLKLSGNLISPTQPETIRHLEKARADGLDAKVIAALDQARKGGLKISQDLYVYSAASASLDRLLPAETFQGGREQLEQRLADPDQRSRVAAAMKQSLRESGRTNYAHAVLVLARRYKSIQGLTIPQATESLHGTTSLDAQIDLILEIAKNGGASINLYEMNENDLLPFLRQPETMFGSDSGVFQTTTESQHPRGYGNAARVLARYVRAEKHLPIEEAVRKMTSLAALTFQLRDRGEIREGAWADLVVFDPATVQDQATFASPHVCATGFKHVFVNGVETVVSDRHTGARAGQPIQRGN